MPNVIPHLLLPAILVALWRDYHLKTKDKKHFPLHYVLPKSRYFYSYDTFCQSNGVGQLLAAKGK